MSIFYLDTSALIKRYAREQGTDWVIALTNPLAENDLYTVRMTGPEMIAALYRKVRTGELPLDDAQRAAANFRADWAQQYQIIEVNVTVADRAMTLAERYGLRGYDAVHLAAALTLHDLRQEMELPLLTFVSADDAQSQAALAEGVLVENSNRH